MIHTSLVTVIAELNTYLRTKLSLSADPVSISDIPVTEVTADDAGGILATLINIQEDKLASQKQSSSKPKAVYLDLYLLFSAAFDSTRNVDALKYVSSVIAFFGGKPHFEAENTPGLEAGIELDFEIHNLTFQEQSDMWRLINVKSRPAVLYKVYGVHVVTE